MTVGEPAHASLGAVSAYALNVLQLALAAMNMRGQRKTDASLMHGGLPRYRTAAPPIRASTTKMMKMTMAM